MVSSISAFIGFSMMLFLLFLELFLFGVVIIARFVLGVGCFFV